MYAGGKGNKEEIPPYPEGLWFPFMNSMNHPNRPHKSKNKKGCGCALCKEWKHGWGPSNDNKTIAEIEAISNLEEKVKLPSKAKPKPRTAWSVRKHYRQPYWIKKPHTFKYHNERDARNAYDNAVVKMRDDRLNRSLIIKIELIDPKGLTKEFENDERK